MYNYIGHVSMCGTGSTWLSWVSRCLSTEYGPLLSACVADGFRKGKKQ